MRRRRRLPNTPTPNTPSPNTPSPTHLSQQQPHGVPASTTGGPEQWSAPIVVAGVNVGAVSQQEAASIAVQTESGLAVCTTGIQSLRLGRHDTVYPKSNRRCSCHGVGLCDLRLAAVADDGVHEGRAPGGVHMFHAIAVEGRMDSHRTTHDWKREMLATVYGYVCRYICVCMYVCMRV